MPNDFADFTRAVAFRDQATNDTNGSIGVANGIVTPFDVSQAQAAYLTVQWAANAALKLRQLELTFFDGNGIIPGGITVQIVNLGYQFGGEPLTVALPMQGQTLKVIGQAEDGAAMSLSLTTSTRPLDRLHLLGNVIEGGAQLLDQMNVAVPAGGTIGPFTVPPVARAYGLHIGPSDTHLTYVVQAVRANLGGGLALSEIANVPGSTAGHDINELLISGRALRVSVINSDVAIHQSQISMWDAS